MPKPKPPPRAAPPVPPFMRPQGTGEALAQVMQRAIAAYQRGEWGEAEALGRSALAARADSFDALHLLGIIAAQTRRVPEAAELLSRAVSVNPASADALNNLGNVLRDLGHHARALACYERALALRPDHASAWNNRGTALRELQRHGEALESFTRAIVLKPDFAEAYGNRGNLLHEMKRDAQAMESYRHALRIRPDFPYLFGGWLFARMNVCDWNGIEDDFARLAGSIDRGEKASIPFPVLSTPCSAATQLKGAATWADDRYPANATLAAMPKHPRHGKLRIGYFSAEFHEHPTCRLIAELFERHDRSRFELTAFSAGPDTGDAMRLRLSAAFDRFIDVRGLPDRDVAMRARELEIDIAVDLSGHTQDGRPGVFAHRAAPVQVNYLGYPGTMGAAYYDYLVADAVLVPEGLDRHYAEAIVRLPDTYQPNDSTRRISGRVFSREELGLPREGFVFCCFNNNFKISPGTFGGWMRVLGRVEGSVVWLLQGNELAADNLRKEAALRGIDPGRLVFARRIPLPEHLARHRAADLFLDTLPYNAHTTASDSLWAGLPVLTCQGETFAGRVAASLLNAIGLPELVTSSPGEYEAAAIELAMDRARLGEIRERLARNRLTYPLFDIGRFARHLEAAYLEMHERHQAGCAPGPIRVPG